MTELHTHRRRYAALAAVAVGAPLLVVAAQSTTAAQSKEVLTFTGHDATFRQFDRAPKGEHPTAGDSFVFTSHLFDDGTRVGSLHATCLVTRRTANPDNTPLLCHGTYVLPGGQLVGSALVGGGADSPEVPIAITGGTGAYAGATGQSVEAPGPDGTTLITITLE